MYECHHTHIMYMQNCLKKPQGLRICIAMMQHMELTEKMKYLTSKHLGPKLNNPRDDVKLCAILLCMIPQQWESTCCITESEVVGTI